MDKHYLGELAGAGVPITPTVFVEPGETAVFPASDFVVKPAIGAGSRDASAYGPDQHALAIEHLTRLHAQGTSVLVQPFLASVATDGEWPLVFFRGRYSHAASKRVALPGPARLTTCSPPRSMCGTSPATSRSGSHSPRSMWWPPRVGTPAYARVDLVNDDDQHPCVLEVELIEPSLFLPYAEPAAVERMVDAFTN